MKKKSLPSLLGGLVVGGVMIIAGGLISSGSDFNGHLVGASGSALLVGVGMSRYLKTSKMMPALPMVALGIISSGYHFQKAYEWA